MDEKGCTVRNKCTSLDSVWMRLSSGGCGFGHGDKEYDKTDYMLGHKLIGLDNEQKRDKLSYYWKNGNGIRSGMNLGHTHTLNNHSRSDDTVDNFDDTLGQKYRDVDNEIIFL